MVEDVKAGSEGSQEKLLQVFEIEDQALFYTKSHGVHSRDLYRRDQFLPFASETALHYKRHFWRKDLT